MDEIQHKARVSEPLEDAAPNFESTLPYAQSHGDRGEMDTLTRAPSRLLYD